MIDNLGDMDRKMADEYADFAAEEYAAGSIDRATYFKVCAILASEYLKDFADVEACLRQMHIPDPDYYTTTFVKQLEEDGLFYATMQEFMVHLERWGVTHMVVHRPTQRIAEA